MTLRTIHGMPCCGKRKRDPRLVGVTHTKESAMCNSRWALLLDELTKTNVGSNESDRVRLRCHRPLKSRMSVASGAAMMLSATEGLFLINVIFLLQFLAPDHTGFAPETDRAALSFILPFSIRVGCTSTTVRPQCRLSRATSWNPCRRWIGFSGPHRSLTPIPKPREQSPSNDAALRIDSMGKLSQPRGFNVPHTFN